MERSVKNKAKKKPQLIIQTGQGNPQTKIFKRKPFFRNQVQIKPPMSAKNRHEMKNVFNFGNVGQTASNLIEKQQNKLKTLQRLEYEKMDLMKSLQILKQGAVSAIVQKEEEIMKLKDQIFVSSNSSIKNSQKQEQQSLNTKLYQKELQLKQLYRRQLEDEVEELRKQLRKQRIRFQSELYEKEQMINSLCVELDSSYQKIQKLQKFDEILTEKIRSIQTENVSLLKQLETSQHVNNSQLNNSFFLNISSVTQKGHNRGNSFVSQDTLFDQGTNSGDYSYASTVPIKKYSEQMFLNQQEDQHSNSVVSQRIQSIKQKHQQEVVQIKKHYEQQIKRLKMAYSKQSQQIRLSTQSNRESKNEMLRNNSSTSSLHSVNSRKSDYEENRSMTRYKTTSFSNLTLSKNPSMERLRFDDKMYSIKENAQNDEAGTPRYHISLKDQILQNQICPSTLNAYQNNNQNYDTTTTISSFHNYFNNRNSYQKGGNEDTISQFTAKYFEYPLNGNRFQSAQKIFKRTNSIATFQGEPQQTITVQKINSVENNIGSFRPESIENINSPLKSTFKDQISSSKQIIMRSNTETQQDQDDRISIKSNKYNTSKSSLKKDLMLFCVGLVTGGTLFSLGNKIINK